MSNSLTPDGLVMFKCPACGARPPARMAAWVVRVALEHPGPPSEVLLTVQCRCRRIVTVHRADVRLAA